ncbi:hypothetical protein [Actinophytocola gossypii]|uniref:Uncharacterized protein n=1 Tax=Actinophytocola gossypii TaxID=2812003 RepID=A0ABT2JA98_9PSEU|nr:hypothetical protein [Actinophytocola gossypii]MCT2584636.1 hypothetical protein [Actinophytocola gossypii]
MIPTDVVKLRCGGVGSISRAIAQHGLEDVESSARERHDGLGVSFPLVSLAVVVGILPKFTERTGCAASCHALFDGLLRKRQVQAPAVGGGRLLTDIRYDSHGCVHKETQPYYNNAPIDTDLWVASDIEIPGLTRTEYDGADRVVAQVFQDGAVDKWRTTTITNARGHTTELRQYQADTPTGDYDAPATPIQPHHS